MVPKNLFSGTVGLCFVREILFMVNQFLHPELSIKFKIGNIAKSTRQMD